MLPIKDQLSILAHLSKADEVVADEERNLIRAIGNRNGLTPEEVDEIITNPNEIGDLSNVLAEEKFDCLYTLVQLMKIDRKVYSSEIIYCERIAWKLGYKPGVIADLSQYIFSDPAMSSSPRFLQKLANKQLLKKET